MKIDIKHIAKLSRLQLEESQVEKFQQQMQGIVDMVEKMPPMDGKLAVDPQTRMELRPDESGPSLRRDVLLQNAPETAAGCVVVPKTVE